MQEAFLRKAYKINVYCLHDYMLVVILTCQTTNSGNKLIGLFALSALSTQRPKSWHSVTRMEENKQNQRIVAKINL